MNNPLCALLGIEFPLLAFSHCRDVVAAVTNAGGFGVLGASSHTPEQLELELKWIDEHVGGRPYGVDVLIPENMAGADGSIGEEGLRAQLPAAHKQFTMALHGPLRRAASISTIPHVTSRRVNLLPETTDRLLDVAFAHPISLIANALGVPPPG